MQEPVFGPKKSITITMLVVLGICFVLQSVLFSYSLSGSQFLRQLLGMHRINERHVRFRAAQQFDLVNRIYLRRYASRLKLG